MMETPWSLTTFQLLVITLITVGLIKFISLIYPQLTYWRNKRVPRIKGIPVIGTFWKLYFRRMHFTEVIDFVYHYDENLKYVGATDFSTPLFIIRDPELIKNLGVKNFEHFPDHRGFVTEEMDPIFGKNVFSLRGDRWREMRNILSPSFTASKMKFMFDLVAKCSSNFVDYLSEHPEVCSSIEAKEIYTRYTNDVIATVAFGISVNSLEDRENEFYKRGKEVTNSFNGILNIIKLLSLRLSPGLMRKVGVGFLSRSTSKFFRRTISETVRARDERGITRPDMLHLLMQVRDNSKPLTDPMTIDDIVAQAFIFFLAGFDTSSTVMCFITHELALHQDVQQRLREEIDHFVAEGDGKITYEALSKMEYMDMMVSEILRLYPPVVVIDRLCTQKFQLAPAGPGYESVTVEPDCMLWFPVYALHRDPKYFPDPEKFDPERFSEENKQNIVPYTYIPFGVGPRQCIGNRFALMETKIVIAHLLQKFIIKPTSKTRTRLDFTGSFQLIPKDGIWFALEKRDA